MDSKINKLKSIIESKKEKYPNVSNLWLNFIDQKYKSFDKTIDNAIDTFNNLEKKISDDLSMNSILMLFFLYHNKL